MKFTFQTNHILILKSGRLINKFKQIINLIRKITPLKIFELQYLTFITIPFSMGLSISTTTTHQKLLEKRQRRKLSPGINLRKTQPAIGYHKKSNDLVNTIGRTLEKPQGVQKKCVSAIQYNNRNPNNNEIKIKSMEDVQNNPEATRNTDKIQIRRQGAYVPYHQNRDACISKTIQGNLEFSAIRQQYPYPSSVINSEQPIIKIDRTQKSSIIQDVFQQTPRNEKFDFQQQRRIQQIKLPYLQSNGFNPMTKKLSNNVYTHNKDYIGNNDNDDNSIQRISSTEAMTKNYLNTISGQIRRQQQKQRQRQRQRQMSLIKLKSEHDVVQQYHRANRSRRNSGSKIENDEVQFSRSDIMKQYYMKSSGSKESINKNTSIIHGKTYM